MADGSPDDRAGLQSANDLTFSAPDDTLCDSKKCSAQTLEGDSVKLSFYRELDVSESCESRGVPATRAVYAADSQKRPYASAVDSIDRKKRCIDRYDSSESSDSGVAVLSPTESSNSSDITEPRSPRSPESACSSGGCGAEDGAGRMPPWASEPAPPPAARRFAVQHAPRRRLNPVQHRCITDYFYHKMKPQNGLKRDHTNTNNDNTKKKCLPKNGVTNDLEKYISYLSQTLNPKVLKDVGGQAEVAVPLPATSTANETTPPRRKPSILCKKSVSSVVQGMLDFGRPKEGSDIVHNSMNGFMEIRQQESFLKDKLLNGHVNRNVDSKKHGFDMKKEDSPANKVSKHAKSVPKGKVPISALPMAPVSRSPIKLAAKPDNSKMNSVVSSTTKLDSRMNGVMCGSNNLSLSSTHKKTSLKRELTKKTDTSPSKRTNRKSAACIANSKNLTWSKANNLKQIQLQKQNCTIAAQTSSAKIPLEANSAPKMTIPNGVRQVSMAMNGNLGNLNMPMTNLQNCHQLNIPQPCNGTVTSNNLTSFVAVPHNVMLTTLRIPQNGIPAQTLAHQNNINNMTSFSQPNVNVSSPTKLNGQFVFPLMQNINGTVVQLPNLMAKMPNFVLPQSPQMPQRQDHLQNAQHTAQFLINGTLLKLANTMPPPYQSINKNAPISSQSIPPMNKNLPGVPTVGMPVQPKPNYAVSFSHPVLMPQAGFIVTSVPNMNVKETWSNTGSTATAAQSTCSNHLVNRPPPLFSFTNQTLHTSSIPIAPVKPPDNPIQGTEPPSSTVKEPETNDVTIPKCDIPWLSKTFNNNFVQLESSSLPERPFSQVSSTLSEKIEQLTLAKVKEALAAEKEIEEKAIENDNGDIEKMEDDSISDEIDSRSVESEELRKVEEVARREETIFTQITVLKDVSSNVHTTVIEANFATESTESESGIGTDKSIYSPSDSQTSKECDDDSSLSLSVSVCMEQIDVPSQKSPILKQPKTLRFPPRNLIKTEPNGRRSSSYTSTVSICLWENCKKKFDGDPDLLEHLQSEHVETQNGKENYVCLWQQCKVKGKPSCSRLWLERHTLSHGGNKPFKCIFDGCERRFSTQTLLERHVNHHINDSLSGAGSGKKSADSASKLMRKNGKKLRYRRQPWSARMFDFFDSGMMEGLRHRLHCSTLWRLGGGCPLREPSGRHTLTLHTALAGSRYNTQLDRREALVTYYPPHVLEDEWVPEKEVTKIKRVEIAELPVYTKVLLYEQFCATYRQEVIPTHENNPSVATSTSSRLVFSRSCNSSRVLNNLIAKQRKCIDIISERKPVSGADKRAMVLKEDENKVSGAKKRKMGRRHGGNSFWPCGR